jgi:hypothetical protein
MTLAWKSVQPAEWANLARTLLRTLPDEAALGLAVRAYDQKNDAQARDWLKDRAQPGAVALAKLIDARDAELQARKRAELNAAAEAAYAKAGAALEAGNTAEVLKQCKELLGTYAQAECVQENSEAIAGLASVARMLESGEASLPAGNMALASAGAAVKSISGRGTNMLSLIDGKSRIYTGTTGFAYEAFPCDWQVTLANPSVLREVRLLLWDGGERYYRYKIETSLDGKNWQMLADHSTGEPRSWQVLSCAPRAVKYIRVKGLFNSANTHFHVVELEAYAKPPAEKPVSTKGLAGGDK